MYVCIAFSLLADFFEPFPYRQSTSDITCRRQMKQSRIILECVLNIACLTLILLTWRMW